MLPLLAGIAVGAGAVVAINNHKELKEKFTSGAKVVQDTAIKTKDVVVEKAKAVKKTVEKKVDCLTSQKETKVVEK